MSKHIHKWVLKPEQPKPSVTNYYYASRWGSRANYLHALEDIVDIIHNSELPTITKDVWVCHCGEEKTNWHEHPSLLTSLKSTEKTK